MCINGSYSLTEEFLKELKELYNKPLPTNRKEVLAILLDEEEQQL